MKRQLLWIGAVLVTLLYGSLLRLWFYPVGAEAPLPGDTPMRIGERVAVRGVPIVASREYSDLRIELDGRPLDPRDAFGQRRDAMRAVRLAANPDAQRTFAEKSGIQIYDITFLQPEDGPRPGLWTREEHWARATWAQEGKPQERVLCISSMLSAVERDLGPGRNIESVMLEMWPPASLSYPPPVAWVLQHAPGLRTVVGHEPSDLRWFWWFVLCAISSVVGLVIGMCGGHSPRSILALTTGALVLGPFWFLLAWLVGPGPRFLWIRARAGTHSHA